MIKWKVRDVIKAVEGAISSTPNQGGGNDRLMQQLKAKAQGGQPQVRR